MMKLLFRFSGEHPSLPRAELFAVLEGEGIGFEVLHEFEKERILVIETDSERKEFLQRLALTKIAGEFAGISNCIDEIATSVAEKILTGHRIAVRSSLALEKELGAKLKEGGFEIDLEKPEFSIPLSRIGRLYLAAIEIPLKRNFDQRKPQFRPYFHPTSMHPKIARVLVNLARVKKGNSILDPFCGTGGILIEAGLMGIKARGSDIDEEMVAGCSRNLQHYDIEGEIKLIDAMKIDKEFSDVDAIVTDMPYGRSSFTTEKDLRKFYNEFISVAGNLLQKGRYLVIVMPDKFTPEPENFSVVDEFSLYVHKSLTRKILVMKRGRHM